MCGHEQKRMGNRLLALKKTKLTDGSGRRVQWGRGEGGEGGRNRITKNTILLQQKYYGKAIRSHVNNVEGMKGAVWAVIYHSLSTDDYPQNQFFPTGERLWCKYQLDVAKSEQLPTQIPTLDLAQFVKHVFEDLSS